MKIRNEGYGWICSKVKRATLWKNVGIREKLEKYGERVWKYLEYRPV